MVRHEHGCRVSSIVISKRKQPSGGCGVGAMTRLKRPSGVVVEAGLARFPAYGAEIRAAIIVSPRV